MTNRYGRSRDDDTSSSSGAGALGRVLVLAGVGIIGSIRGCAVNATLDTRLHEVDGINQTVKVGLTKFSPSETEGVHQLTLKGKANVPLYLEQGVNEIHLKCKDGDDKTYTYDFHGAIGDISVGQHPNFAGSPDDIHVSRPNGENLRLTNNCPGDTKYFANGTSTVYVEVGR